MQPQTLGADEREKLGALIAELEAKVPKEAAQVSFPTYGGGVDESYMVANERGYLRFGIEMLKAAIAPPAPGPGKAVDVDLKYLWSRDTEVRLDWLERREDVPMEPAPAARNIAGQCIAIALLGLFLLCAIIGFATVVRWLFW